MQTVANPASQSKPVVAYHAQFMGLSGIITKPTETVLFLEAESGAVIRLVQSDYADLVVLGRVDLSVEQLIADLVEGRAAKVCGRSQEVR